MRYPLFTTSLYSTKSNNMSNKEIIKETNKLMKGLREADYQLIKQKSMLGQNIITEDTSGNIIEIPAKDLYEKTFL